MSDPHEPPDTSPGPDLVRNRKRRPARIAIWVFSSLTLMALAGWTGISLLVPVIVRQQLDAALRGAGLRDVKFELHQASPWRTDVAKLSGNADDTLLEIGSAIIRYSPLEAIGGQLDTIQLRDARLVLDLDGLDFGFDSTGTTRPTSAPTAPRSRLPVRSIELETCVLELRRRSSEAETANARSVQLQVSGTLLRTPGGPSQLNLRARLPGSGASKGAILIVHGSIDPLTGAADVSGELDGADLAPLVALLPPEVQPLIGEAGGSVDAKAAYRRLDHSTPPSSTANLSVSGGFVVGEGEYAGEVRGISVAVKFDDVIGLATPPGQKASAQRLRFASEEFSDVSVEFQMRGPGEISVSSAHVGWAGGRFNTGPFTARLPSTDVDLAVAAEQVDLNKVLTLISDGRATGSGQLRGRIPLMVDWPRVRFGEGFLESVGGGTIQLGEAVGDFGELLDQSDPRFARDPRMRRVKQQILEAMKDFEYHHLSATLTRSEGPLLVVVRIQGRGRTGIRQPLDITLNSRGLEEGLNSYLAAQSRVLTIGGGRRGK
jgi:hypothetical protein